MCPFLSLCHCVHVSPLCTENHWFVRTGVHVSLSVCPSLDLFVCVFCYGRLQRQVKITMHDGSLQGERHTHHWEGIVFKPHIPSGPPFSNRLTLIIYNVYDACPIISTFVSPYLPNSMYFWLFVSVIFDWSWSQWLYLSTDNSSPHSLSSLEASPHLLSTITHPIS